MAPVLLPTQPPTAMLLPLLLLLLPHALLAIADGPALQCRDADGSPLDWFAVLKQPEDASFAYVSSRQPAAWTPGQDLRAGGPVFETLAPLFGSSPVPDDLDILAAYNDEPPGGGDGSSFGHMKGVVALKLGQPGFWLIHSVPKFPDLSQSAFSYPNTGIKYGQSFLCLSLDGTAAAGDVGRQLFASHPDLYTIDVSQGVIHRWQVWDDLSKGKRPPKGLMNSTVTLGTVGGLPVLHVAKSPNLHLDLYSGLLAGQLNSNLQVETWQHGDRLLNSSCGLRYNVTKVVRVQIAPQLPEFESTQDHSKWCVATARAASASPPFVCIGDMNRAETQFRRGGGVACVALDGPHRLFQAAVLGDVPCGGGGVRAAAVVGDAAEVQSVLPMFKWLLAGITCVAVCSLLLLLRRRRPSVGAVAEKRGFSRL